MKIYKENDELFIKEYHYKINFYDYNETKFYYLDTLNCAFYEMFRELNMEKSTERKIFAFKVINKQIECDTTFRVPILEDLNKIIYVLKCIMEKDMKLEEALECITIPIEVHTDF